jgi:hypothetical protein
MFGVSARLSASAALVAALGPVTGLVAAAPAAAAEPEVTTLSTAYVGPSGLGVGDGRVLVTDGRFLTQVGRSAPLAVVPKGGALTAVAAGAGTAYAYAGIWPHRGARLVLVGSRTVAVDLAAYERRANPDRRAHYGVPSPSACVRKAFKDLDGGSASYTGRVGSRPGGLARAGATWYVADSAAGDVLRVDASGRVSTVAVLPPHRFTFTKRLVAALGMPSCVVGVRYDAEPVPTDVAVGPDGALWVTTLPGLYDLGQPGRLYRIDPRTRKVRLVAGGIAGARNVAVSSSGVVYVVEQLLGRISTVTSAGRLRPFVTLPDVTAVEASGSYVYAAVAARIDSGIRRTKGRIVRIPR